MLKALVPEIGKGYRAEVLAAGGECFHKRRTPARPDHLPSMPNHTPRLTLCGSVSEFLHAMRICLALVKFASWCFLRLFSHAMASCR